MSNVRTQSSQEGTDIPTLANMATLGGAKGENVGAYPFVGHVLGGVTSRHLKGGCEFHHARLYAKKLGFPQLDQDT